MWLKGSASQGGDVMKMKRAVHEEIINKEHQKHSRECAEKVNLMFWTYE